eukprot:7777672-Heterocapsa_arctica.AAC.1
MAATRYAVLIPLRNPHWAGDVLDASVIALQGTGYKANQLQPVPTYRNIGKHWTLHWPWEEGRRTNQQCG